MDDERYCWIGLKLIDGIGPVLYKKLLEEIGAPELIFSASRQQLAGVAGIHERIISDIQHFKLKDQVIHEIEQINVHHVSLIHFFHPQYPSYLKNIHDPPPFLYVLGEIWKQDDRSIAIVGSRKPTSYGKQVTKELADSLARAQLTVVSGFATGIDQIAHEAALNGGGRTLAVLGSGIDVHYPWGSQRLKDAISCQGAVVSEFAMGTLPIAENFPKRNRLISGLSMGVVVIEAAEKSGSLITASTALDQGREVFAVPGPIHSELSRGTHALIKSGAKLVENVTDIFDELEFQFMIEAPQRIDLKKGIDEDIQFPLDLNPDEKKIYDILTGEPIHLDEVSVQAGFSSHRCCDILLRLELQGLALQLEGNQFIKNQFTRGKNE